MENINYSKVFVLVACALLLGTGAVTTPHVQTALGDVGGADPGGDPGPDDPTTDAGDDRRAARESVGGPAGGSTNAGVPGAAAAPEASGVGSPSGSFAGPGGDPGTADLPSASPAADENPLPVDTCEVPVGPDDLPLEDAPGPSDVPEELHPPGVPVGLLPGPEGVARMVWGAAPGPCDVFDPGEPPIDPSDPGGDPYVTYDVTNYTTVGTDSARAVGIVRAGHHPRGTRGAALGGVAAGGDGVAAAAGGGVSDGRMPDYLQVGVEGELSPTARSGSGRAVVALFGRSAAAGPVCENVSTDVSPDDPTAACRVETDGVPSVPVGPGDLIGMARGEVEDRVGSGASGATASSAPAGESDDSAAATGAVANATANATTDAGNATDADGTNATGTVTDATESVRNATGTVTAATGAVTNATNESADSGGDEVGVSLLESTLLAG